MSERVAHGAADPHAGGRAEKRAEVPGDVDVCLCTFRRPTLIGACLASVLAQKLPPGLAFGRIVVVDNDAAGSARETIAALAADSAVPIRYDIVETPSIALARNRCLSHVRAACFAFIDDDEVADPGWLAALHGALVAHEADFVQGAVVPVHDADTPRWVIDSGAFERPRPPTGSPLSIAATNNVLVRTSVLRRLPDGFEARYGRTGGEDSAFFHALVTRGARGVACDEAVVRERIEPERRSVRYLMRRSMASGEHYFRLVSPDAAPGWRWRFAARKLVHGVGAAVLVVLTLPFGRARQVRWLREAARARLVC